MRPSARCDAPAQNRFVLPIGLSTIVPVAGFHTRSGHVFVKSPENINTDPVCIRIAFTATRPSSKGGSHRPTTEGSLGFTTVTETLGDVALFPAASRAVAASWCVPPDVPVVSQVTLYGATVSSAPSSAPSRRNCTPTTPPASVAAAVTVTVPVTDAPADGDVIVTTGGVVSDAVTENDRGAASVPAIFV